MKNFTIRNWTKHQHYLNRCPPWIKLENSLMDHYGFDQLSDESKLILILIWLFGSKLGTKKPLIPNDPVWLKKKLNLKKDINLKPLFDEGFLIPINDTEPERLQDDSAKTREEEEAAEEKAIVQKKETPPNRRDFDEFWKTFPSEMKKGKEVAWGKFQAQINTRRDFKNIQKALINYKRDIEHIRKTHFDRAYQHGSTWFNHNWEDYIDMAKPESHGAKTNGKRFKTQANLNAPDTGKLVL